MTQQDFRLLSEIDKNEDFDDVDVLEAFQKAHATRDFPTSLASVKRQMDSFMAQEPLTNRDPMAAHTWVRINYGENRKRFVGVIMSADVAKILELKPEDGINVTALFNAIPRRDDALLEGRVVPILATRQWHIQPIAACFATPRTIFAMDEAKRAEILPPPRPRN